MRSKPGCDQRSGTGSKSFTLQSIRRGVDAAGGEGHRQVAGAAEEVAEQGDRIGDAQFPVIVTVGSVDARAIDSLAMT